jgi:GNAT superfamily N-acetyltransferase
MMAYLKADLTNSAHARATVELLNEYAKDFFGGGEPLSDYARDHIIEELLKRQTANVFLAAVDVTEFVGLAICFEGFSTFACKPLLNIHDLYVSPKYRRQGVSTELIFFIGKMHRLNIH